LIVHLYLALPTHQHQHPPPWDTPLYRLLQECKTQRQEVAQESATDTVDHPHFRHPHRHQHPQHHQNHHHHPQNHQHRQPQHVQQGQKDKAALEDQCYFRKELEIPAEEAVTVTVTVIVPSGPELTLEFLVS
ncbi:E4 protein, partial [Delphinus delphis papillomavirus 1]